MNHVQKLAALHVCSDAMSWAKNYPDAQTAWDACERGDWMLWLIGKTIAGAPRSDQRRRLVCATSDCAALAPVIADDGQELARQWVIDAAKRWGEGEDNGDEVNAAAYAAAHAAYAAYAAADAAYGRKKVLAKCADIVRKYYPPCPIKE